MVRPLKLGKKHGLKTSSFLECWTPERKNNSLKIIEKSNPESRNIVVLINEEIGL